MKIITSDFKSWIHRIHQTSQGSTDPALHQKLLDMKAAILQNQDQALIQYTRQLDKIPQEIPFALAVTKTEIKNAHDQVPKSFISALLKAKENIKAYHQYQMPKNFSVDKESGIQYGLKYTPIETVGLYVPGGRAPYPSTVLMNAIPAKIASVPKIVMVTPPNAKGEIAPQILVAADCCGIDTIYKIGGAQAVFALAYGTETIPKVDKIVGPGNIYVTKAKQMVFGDVAIDKPAGPSDVLVYIQDPKYISFAAADLLAQLEHDPSAVAIAVSEDKKVLDDLFKEVSEQMKECSRKEILRKSIENVFLFQSENEAQSIEMINLYAAEHVVLLVDKPKTMLDKIKNAGAIFLGPYTPVTLGDYYAGTNHVLPTSGAARFASPLGVMDFLKYSSILSYSKEALRKAQPDIEELTKMEGFDAHQKAMDRRLI